MLSGDPVSLSDLCQATEFDHLSVITAGSGNATSVELLHSGKFGTLMTRLQQHFDVVLIDTPPMLHMADARILAREVQSTILVFRSGVTTREDFFNDRSMIYIYSILFVGSILNDFNPRAAGKAGYYSSYSAYRRDSEEEHAEVQA